MRFRVQDVPADLAAAAAITFLAIPQGVAYALIAGLPPIAGLYAATLPAIVGGLFRSSKFVVAGPTNALSLLVGGAIAAQAADLDLSPAQIGVQLALMVGVFQLAAGGLRLGRLVDFVSAPVVLGYISGAGVLIGIGQLPNVTNTAGGSGNLFLKVIEWSRHLEDAHALSVGLALGTAVALVGLRRIDRRIPAALVVLAAGVAANVFLGLHSRGLVQLSDLSAMPSGLPPLTLPSALPTTELLSLAVAATVLSLIESTAVARNIAAASGETLDNSREFVGQGMSNLAAGLVGGYPVSGSLSRSILNFRIGARTRMAGVYSGLMVLAALLVAGPIIDRTPLASLAGLLLVVAVDLVDLPRIKKVVRSSAGDGLSFAATLLGTWLLPLDQAIYLGVAISVAAFVRRASLLRITTLAVDANGRVREATDDEGHSCRHVRALHVEGALFFGSSDELRQAIHAAASDPEVKAVVVRLKRARGLDATSMAMLEASAESLRGRGQKLLLVGMRPRAMKRLQDSGAAHSIGAENLFPTQAVWFQALDQALRAALDHAGDHGPCPVDDYLRARGEAPPNT